MKKTPPDPAMQGEGNITAARRHRKSTEQFVESGQVPDAARAAEPKSAHEAQELLSAEKKGLSKARK
jgi:hypothetical protein